MDTGECFVEFCRWIIQSRYPFEHWSGYAKQSKSNNGQIKGGKEQLINMNGLHDVAVEEVEILRKWKLELALGGS